MSELFTLLLFITTTCISLSKTIAKKVPILSKICLYILNFFIFYLTFSTQQSTVLSNDKRFDNIGDYLLLIVGFYPFVLLFLFDLSRVYKDYENGKELSNIINLTIVACVLSLIIPGTSYLILSVIVIDLILLFTKKTEKIEIRYLFLILIWFLLILFNYIILK